MKIGISTYACYALPLGMFLPLIAESGYTSFSLGSLKEHSQYHTVEGCRRLYKLTRALGLEMESVHAPAGFREGKLLDISSPDPVVRRYAIEETKYAIEAAAKCQAPYVVVHPIGTKWKEHFCLKDRSESSLESLAILQEYCKKSNVTLTVENLDPPEGIVFDNILKHAMDMGLYFCYDSGHSNIYPNPSQYWELIGSHIRTLHLHDNDGQKDTHSILGEGTFPWKAFGAWIIQANYSGVIGLECRFEGKNPDDLKNWLKANIDFVHHQILGRDRVETNTR